MTKLLEIDYDVIIRILSLLDIQDLAGASCVCRVFNNLSKRVTRLRCGRHTFDTMEEEDAESVITNVISRLNVEELEELVLLHSFSASAIRKLLLAAPFLKRLEIRMNKMGGNEAKAKLDSLALARRLVSLKVTKVSIISLPNWEMFKELTTLEISHVTLDEGALKTVLQQCPFLSKLSLKACKRIIKLTIDSAYLMEFVFSAVGDRSCSILLVTPLIQSLEITANGSIKVTESAKLKILALSGQVTEIDMGHLPVLETLCIKGKQWCPRAIRKLLTLASVVENLVLDFNQPLPNFCGIRFGRILNSQMPNLKHIKMLGYYFEQVCEHFGAQDIKPPMLDSITLMIRSSNNIKNKTKMLHSLASRTAVMIIKDGVKVRFSGNAGRRYRRVENMITGLEEVYPHIQVVRI